MITAAENVYPGEDFLIELWPDCKQWLCVPHRSADWNARKVYRCMRRYLGLSLAIIPAWHDWGRHE